MIQTRNKIIRMVTKIAVAHIHIKYYHGRVLIPGHITEQNDRCCPGISIPNYEFKHGIDMPFGQFWLCVKNMYTIMIPYIKCLYLTITLYGIIFFLLVKISEHT